MEVVGQERRFFPCIGVHGPIPVRVIAPKRRIGEGRDELAVGSADHGTAHMVEMQMCQKHVGDVFPREPDLRQTRVQAVSPMQVVVAEKFLRLFVANAAIDENQAVLHLHQQGAHGPRAQILAVCRVGPGPKLLGNNPKHGPAVQFEIPGVNRVKAHGGKV